MTDQPDLALRRAFAAHPDKVGAVAGWTLLAALPALATGWLIARAVDAVVGGNVAAAGWSLAGFAAVSVLEVWAAPRNWRAVADLVEAVRADLTEAFVTGSLAAAVHGDRPGAAGGAEITDHLESVRGSLQQLVGMGWPLLSTVGAVAGAATLAPVLGAVLAPFLLAAAAVTVLLARAVAGRLRRMMLRDEGLMDLVAAHLEGVRDVVAAGARGRAAALAAPHIHAATDAQLALTRAHAYSDAAVTLLLYHGPLLAVIALTPWLVARGSLTVGAAVGAVAYVQFGLREHADNLQTLAFGVVEVRTYLRRLSERMAAPPIPVGGAEPDRTAATLRTERLSFAYGPTARPIIAGLDLEIPEGDHLAIVGPSGIGKSTLALLLAGVLQPTAGRVCLGDVAVTDLDDAARSRWLAVVPQESYVFAGTLRENLTYLAADAADARIQAAATAVGLDRVVHRLGGLDAAVDTTTSGLSAGEQQLVTLARTYLSPARVVILDEATCYLDPAGEQQAERAFQRRGGTLIVIAHRMTSSLRARRVMVMDGGDVAVGTHAQLLAENALYADLHGLWAGQLSVDGPATS